MTAANDWRRNDGSDRARDRAARDLLLEDVFPEESPSLETEPRESTLGRSAGPFVAALLIALALAGASWTVASLIAGTRVVPPEVVVAQEEGAERTDLLFTMKPGDGEAGRLEGLRREVRALSGRVQVGASGEIDGIEVDASRLRQLIDALEGAGLGELRVTITDPAELEIAQGEQWEEWSQRLRVRRALRRAERLGGTLIVPVQESG